LHMTDRRQTHDRRQTTYHDNSRTLQWNGYVRLEITIKTKWYQQRSYFAFSHCECFTCLPQASA